MKQKLALPFLLLAVLIVGGWATSTEMKMEKDVIIPLQSSTGENKLELPPLLTRDREEGNDVYFTVEAQKGETEIFKGFKTRTLGYNRSFIGPVMILKNGQNVYLKIKNSLDEETTFHWHGLEIPSTVDGGPLSPLKPGEEKNLFFTVQQEAATLWFHPHPLGKTSKQVFDGLAGLIYIEDRAANCLYLPHEYGKNDFPLIVQDKSFDKKKQLNYEKVKKSDGTQGDTLLINGTVNPYLTVTKQKIRFRILNASNARNYTFVLSNRGTFQQIATDGGLLNQPVPLTKLQLTPGERAEIVIDFEGMNNTDKVALMTEEGTILLPFHITDAPQVKSAYFPTDLNNINLTSAEKNKPVTKQIELYGMGKNVVINGKKFDMNRIDFTQKKGITEVWEIHNKPDMTGGMLHPFHIHGTQFKVISINGAAPSLNLQGYKDTVAIKPGERVRIAVKFDHPGIFMYHCHILEHEENGMMGQVKVQ